MSAGLFPDGPLETFVSTGISADGATEFTEYERTGAVVLDQDYGDSAMQIITVRFTGELPDENAVLDYLRREGAIGWRCGHTHDCCGCVFTSCAELLAVQESYKLAIVAHYVARNV